MNEQSWVDQEESASKLYQYYMRTDPDMRDFLGPIEKEFDPLTGRELRSRIAKIGMVRGAKEENMKEVRVYLEPIPHIRIDNPQELRGWYSSKGDGFIQGKRERPCFTDAILTSPYTGTCEVQCGFCYINAGGRGYRGAGLTAVPMGYGAHVRKQLKKMNSAQAGYFTSFHDPFNSLESYYHNTQEGAQAFVDEGLPIFFLTRLAYPDWAIDMLKRNPHSYAQRSINTPHEDDWRRLSPKGATLDYIWDELKELHRQGIYISIQVNPIIAGIVTHDDIEQLFEKLASCGVDHVIVKFVEANYPWAAAMVDRMVKKFGDNRAAAFKELFTENSSGQQRVVNLEYRLEGHRRYQKKAIELGMTYATCYEYGPKQPDGTYKSIGGDWLTADTCHGHRVPFYTRAAPGVPFKALDVCPPSGCLSCADTNEGKPRCGSELLGAAKALKFSDLKRDPGLALPVN